MLAELNFLAKISLCIQYMYMCNATQCMTHYVLTIIIDRFLLSLASNPHCAVIDDQLNVLPISSHVLTIDPIPPTAEVRNTSMLVNFVSTTCTVLNVCVRLNCSWLQVYFHVEVSICCDGLLVQSILGWLSTMQIILTIQNLHTV